MVCVGLEPTDQLAALYCQFYQQTKRLFHQWAGLNTGSGKLTLCAPVPRDFVRFRCTKRVYPRRH